MHHGLFQNKNKDVYDKNNVVKLFYLEILIFLLNPEPVEGLLYLMTRLGYAQDPL